MAHNEPSEEEINNFFDFGRAASSGEIDSQQPLPLSRASQFNPAWTHGGVINVPGGLTVGPNDNITLPDDFFTSKLPTYTKPDRSCQYCEDLNMECRVFTNEGNKSCFSCISLFRTCSFVDNTVDQGGRVDTLHTVNEDATVEQGGLTGIRPTYTAGASLEQIKAEMTRRGRPRGDPAAAAATHSSTRFSRPIVKVLKAWLDEHADHPYPTNEGKEELRDRTGLNHVQIANWLANARRRGKLRSKRVASPAPNARSQAVDVPTTTAAAAPPGYAPADVLTPFERWQESPPESEAPLAAIARAAASSDFPNNDSGSSSVSHSRHHLSSDSGLSLFRAPSSTSLDTGMSSESIGSAWSHSSSRGSHSSLHGSFNSFARKDRRRKRRLTPVPSPKPPTARRANSVKDDAAATRPFQCTFCTDTFKTKFDWTRHEKSLHLNLEKWICCPNGALEPCPSGHPTVCAYCRLMSPDATHIESHDHSACVDKGLNARTFTRKDHLRQHLRLVHHTKMEAWMESWKSVPEVVRSRCGFCNATFSTWDDRAAHLAKHFREGKSMANWTGGWGFDPDVAACVADAMPPFHIHVERSKPLPWSVRTGATNLYDEMHAQHGTGPHSSNARGWEVLAAVLADYVDACRQRGEDVTDEMLQRHARQCYYGVDDTWNQTGADDAQWLAIFKARVGLVEGGSVSAETAAAYPDAQPGGLPLLAADLGLRSAPEVDVSGAGVFGASAPELDVSGAGTFGASAGMLGDEGGFASMAQSFNPLDFPVTTAGSMDFNPPDSPGRFVGDADMSGLPMDEMMWNMEEEELLNL